MKLHEFREKLDQLKATNSRNDKKQIVRECSDSTAAISFMSGSEFDDAGLGKKTVLGVAQDVYGEEVDGKPTVSDSLLSHDSDDRASHTLTELRRDMRVLAEQSGANMKDYLRAMFRDYDYPSVVSFACLDDEDTGLGDSTIAKALGIKDSLPFYEGVVEAADDPNPRTRPEVGKPFEPMLAAPESRGEPDNGVAQRKVDGYRILIHLKDISDDVELADVCHDVTAYTRRMNDVTESLPELLEIDWPEGDYILDGEVIAADGSYSSTSERIGRKSENVEREVEMRFALFDAIMLRGNYLSEQPYSDRFGGLTVFTNSVDDKRVYHLDIISDIEVAKDDAIENGDEGIIVKDLKSPYEFGKRSSSWQKVKMDDETVDVRISGFAEGEGSATGTLGYVELESSDAVPVGHCGSGWTDAQREEVWSNRDEWLGRTIEVEARGLGTNDNLRMPIFKRDRSEDGEADSFKRIEEVMKDV